ncbi:MAG: HAMP domain-containing protein, partial [Endozoicomonas sp.]
MSSIFLRIYGGLLFSLVLVSVLSGITITIVDGVRLGEYREEMARGTFRLVSEAIEPLPSEQRQDWLDRWGRQLAIRFTLVPSNQLPLDEEQHDQLASGHVHVEVLDEVEARVTSRVSDQWFLQGVVSGISEQMANGTLSLLRDQLRQYPPEQRDDVLRQLSASSLSYPVVLIPEFQAGLTPVQEEQLREGSILMVLDAQNETLQLYARMEDTGRVIRLGPLTLLNHYPFKLILTIGLFVLISLSLAIYILVRRMEKRLRKLERAATRFSRGDFEVRVKVSGADSIGRLAMAFNAMAGHIQRLLSLQKEMIRGVSHELRTPVARLRFGLDLIADAQTVEERETQLNGMDQDIQELDNLVDEFLTYANLEQGAPTIRLKRHDVDKVVAQVVSEHLRLQSRIDIEHIPCNLLNPRRFVEIDRRYLHRAVQNLVGNACRYADSRIQVRFSSTQDTCRIDVDDDG